MQSTNFCLQSRKFFNTNQRDVDDIIPKLGLIKTLKIISDIFLGAKRRSPKEKLPEMYPDLSEFSSAQDDLKFIWFGHSTLLVNLEGQNFLFDPVFSNYAFPIDGLFFKRFQRPILSPQDFKKIDYIVISHNHYDHLDKKTIKFFKNQSIKFITPLGVGKTLQKWGVAREKIVELNWGDEYQAGNAQLICTPAQHGSGRGFFDQDKTLWSSWVLKGKKANMYFSGDSGYGPHFKQIGDQHGPFDFTFIENGQYDEKWRAIHLTPPDTAKAYFDLRGKRLVPIHWGMFDLALHHWLEPIHTLFEISQRENINLLTPLLGEIVSLRELKASRAWWPTTPLPQLHSQEVHHVSSH